MNIEELTLDELVKIVKSYDEDTTDFNDPEVQLVLDTFEKKALAVINKEAANVYFTA